MEKEIIQIYCDGACKGNGKTNSYAGAGVYIPDGSEHGLPEKTLVKVLGKQTNIRAELSAIKIALGMIIKCTRGTSKEFSFIIITDSKFSVDTITKWMKRWKKDGWVRKSYDKKPIANLDLIQEIDVRIELLKQKQYEVKFTYTRGHVPERDMGTESDERKEIWRGNMMADILANKAAEQCNLRNIHDVVFTK